MAHKTGTKSAKPAKPITQEIAATGSDKSLLAGFVSELAQHGDSILKAKGGDLAIYDAVKRDPQVKSTFQQRRQAVVSRDWQVDPGGKRTIDKQAAEFLDEQLKHIRFDEVTMKMLAGVFYGYSVAECLWDYDGARVVMDAVKVRKQKRFRFGRDGSLRLVVRDKPQGLVMPERKFWTFTTGADDDDEPYGLGLAHWLYWPVYFKREGLKAWLIFLDKYGMPTAVGKYHPNAQPEEQKKLLEAAAAVATDTGIIMPEGMALELLEASRSGTADYDALYDKMDAAIAKVVLSQTMTTDDGSSRSQAQVHKDVRDEVVKADADLVCESFNRGPAVWLTEWNFPGAAVPKVWRDIEDAEDLNQRAERDKTVYDMGFEPSEEGIREIYGEHWSKRKTATSPSSAANLAAEPSAAFADPADGDSIDRLIAEALDGSGWEEIMEPLVGDLDEFFAEVENLEDARDRLTDALKHMDSGAFAERLANAAFMGHAVGDSGAPIQEDT